MTDEQKREIAQSLTEQRDNLQQTASEARKMRAELRLKNRDKQIDFLQKLGELSFAFGGAIVPVIIISHTTDTVSHLPYVLVGVAIYILNGVVALWQVKARIEQDADDTPFVGLDEEILAYPVANALNKVISDLGNDDYKKEYWEAVNKVTNQEASVDKTFKPKASFWLDIAILDFVVASLFVIRAVWQYGDVWYWLLFAVSVLLIIALIVVSYIRTIKNQFSLQMKREELQKIRNDYQTWLNSTINPTRKK
jgi:uncharacterized membrane protein YqjE